MKHCQSNIFYDFTFLCRCWNNPAEHVQRLYNTSTFLDDEGYVDDIATLYQVSSLAHTSLEQTLRPKSAAIVMAGRSVHLTTLFPGQALTSG